MTTDSFYSGNYLAIKGSGSYSNWLPYTACDAMTSAGVDDIMYSTCWANGYFTAKFTSATRAMTGFKTAGKSEQMLLHSALPPPPIYSTVTTSKLRVKS